ncbi:MAG: YeeE/YedE thiosulfate transporter family protein [Prolixibacteraceae bacterium]
MTTFVILILGFLFGAILSYANLNKYNVISGMAMLKDLTVAKAILVAIGVGAILLTAEIQLGWAAYHVKPFIAVGIMLGGLIFGSGMAILGYCPGTMAVSLGEGSLDALVGLAGGLTGGLVFTLLFPQINSMLGPDWGKLSVSELIPNRSLFFSVVILIGVILVFAAFVMDRWAEKKDRKWLYAGIALALLNSIVFMKGVMDRPIGASTAFPYLSDSMFGATGNDYFGKIKTPGSWEVVFLIGALLAGLIMSLFRREFKLTLIHRNWEKFRGNSTTSRIFWAFIGGFILIFGARMAGGCTSGHIISGGMQLAISSLVFAVFVFAGLLITGKYFYHSK